MSRHEKIASAIIGEIAKRVHDPAQVGQVQLLVIFKEVCERDRFTPTEKDARRIFEIVQEEIAFGLLKAASAHP